MKNVIIIILFALSTALRAQEIRHPFLGGVYFDYDDEKQGSSRVQPDSIHVYEIRSPTDSGLSGRSHYRYNPSGDIAWADEMWRPFRTDLQAYGDWDTTAFLSCDYDDMGKLTGSLVMVPDEDYLMKTKYLYSSENLRNKEIYTRSFDRINWDSIATLIIEYDEGERISSEIENGFNYNIRKVYTYNDKGNLILKVISDWSALNDEMVSERTEYTYDVNQRLQHADYYGIWGNPGIFLYHEDTFEYKGEKATIVTGKSYNYDGSTWYYTRDTYRQDEAGRLTSETREVNTDNVWTYESCDSSVYDDAGNLVSEATYFYSTGTWAGQWKRDYMRDESGRILRQLEYHDNDGWVLNHTYTYYYTEGLPVAEQPTFTVQFKTYPNPASGNISVMLHTTTGGQLTVYSLCGQPLYRQPLTGGMNRIDYSFPVSGVYLLKISDGKEERTEKIIIR